MLLMTVNDYSHMLLKTSKAVFRSLKRGKKSTVARFGFIWQIVSNR
jgi:hypothetical protein